MACKHMGELMESQHGFECKIISHRCVFLNPDEERCSSTSGGIINYLKAIGTYNKVENDPKCKGIGMSNQERKEAIRRLRKQQRDIDAQLAELKAGCHHELVPVNPMEIEAGGDSYALCSICGETFDWYCPNSPTHLCDYHQEDGSYDRESCIHCGKPSERK